ncbi:MAG TPA: hypothetical protein PLS03_00935 [Terrimicrobiaceae bacterium]|nr:hypothetical protein [Terrimicrobiaceae bacterium]
MPIKSSFLVAGATLLLVCGCANSTNPSSADTPPVAVKGAETAARVVVGRVVGTPAKVAMAAGRAAEVVADKVEGEPNP